MNLPPYGDQFRRQGAFFSTLKVTPQPDPDMSLAISQGGYWLLGKEYMEYSGGSTGVFTAPPANAKWCLLVMNNSGYPQIVNGVASTDPVLPVAPANTYPLVAVYLEAGDTQITSEKIFDIRNVFGTIPYEHNLLERRDVPECHPISAIDGLQAELDDRPELVDFNNALAGKADVDGTPDNIFTMNKDFTGTPASHIYFTVERGTETNTGIRWNETLNRWEFTNDGIAWNAIGTGGAGTVAFADLTDGPGALSGHGDEWIKVNAGGTALEFTAAPSSGGVSTFLALTDVTEGSFAGQSGNIVAVNTGETGLEFIAPPSGGVTAFADLTDGPGALSGHGDEWIKVNAGGTALEYTSAPSGTSTYVGLTDTPGSITANGIVKGNTGGTALDFLAMGTADQVLKVNSGGTALEFATSPSGVTTWVGLSDTAGSITANGIVKGNAGGSALDFLALGTADQVLKVNGTGDGLEFATSPAGVTTWVGLTDTPTDYSGASAGDYVVVNGTTDGLEFATPPTVPTDITDLDDTPADYSGASPGDVLQVNGTSDGLVWATPSSGGSAGHESFTINIPDYTIPASWQVLDSTGAVVGDTSGTLDWTLASSIIGGALHATHSKTKYPVSCMLISESGNNRMVAWDALTYVEFTDNASRTDDLDSFHVTGVNSIYPAKVQVVFAT